MRWFSTVLAFVLTMPTYAQENDAEKLFRQMEKKITAAKTIKVRIEKTWADPQLKSLKEVTTLVLGEGDKAFCELFTSGKGISIKAGAFSDGNKVYVRQSIEDKAELVQDTPKNLGKHCRAVLARFGPAGISTAFVEKKLPDFNRESKPATFQFKVGAVEKVGGAETQVVENTVFFPLPKPKGNVKVEESVKVSYKLWINTRTYLPAKRAILGDDGKVIETDTYLEFTVDGKLDDKLFEAPK
jgi:outer membrane lipoprotein-sorting protein